MKPTALLTLLLGALTLSSCGQTPGGQTPGDQAAGAPAAPEAAAAPAPLYTSILTPEQQQQLRQEIAEAQQVREDVRAGSVASPLNDDGTPVDFDALIRGMQDELQRGQQELSPAPGASTDQTLSPQAAPYAQRIYTDIAGDDRFLSNYNFNRRTFPRFVWSNDGCSGPSAYTGWSDEFFWPCVQHDFGYRQIKARFYPNLATGAHREWVDGQFLQHMRQKCDTLGWREYPCRVAAQAFWAAVRARGAGSFYP